MLSKSFEKPTNLKSDKNLTNFPLQKFSDDSTIIAWMIFIAFSPSLYLVETISHKDLRKGKL
jgi:hypothetical protein